MHLCQSLYNLASFIYNNFHPLYLFSPFLTNLLSILENITYLSDSYDANNSYFYNYRTNLAEKSFIVISELIECSREQDKILISFFMEKIHFRLIETQDIAKYNNNKDKFYLYQLMLCLMVQSLCRSKYLQEKFINFFISFTNRIKNYFNIIENYFNNFIPYYYQ